VFADHLYRTVSVWALVRLYPYCWGATSPFSSVDQRLPSLSCTQTKLTQGCPWRGPSWLLSNALTVILVAWLCRDGCAVVLWFGGRVRIRRCIIVRCRRLLVCQIPEALTQRFWELWSNRILGFQGKGGWLYCKVDHPLVNISLLWSRGLRRWVSMRWLTLALIRQFIAGLGYLWLECRRSCVSPRQPIRR